MHASEPDARGAWRCSTCGTENEPDARQCLVCSREPDETTAIELSRGVVCPACGAQNPTGSASCAACGWPFPTDSATDDVARASRKDVPGLYMGRDPALHDAATREEPNDLVKTVWMAIQILCALIVVAFLVGLFLGRVRPIGGPGLILLAAALFIGGRALWRFADFITGGQRRA